MPYMKPYSGNTADRQRSQAKELRKGKKSKRRKKYGGSNAGGASIGGGT